MSANYKTKKKGTIYSFRVLEVVFGAFLMIVVAFFVHDFERILFPVVKDFNITSVIADKYGLEVKGEFEKTRNCRCVTVTAYMYDGPEDKIPKLIPVRISTEDILANKYRAPIPQKWGPWYITTGDLRGDEDVRISLYITHRCHAMYTVTQKLGEIDLATKKPGN